ncbi:MAG: Omp28-related outer membrane protein [Chitinophagaceae bacterium]|nr:Omp28-related outer membrane protein [Chitinophagaceae bacterium]
MKKILSVSLFALAAFGFSACKKVNSSDTGTSPFYTTPTNTNTGGGSTLPVGNVPAKFTQKALIEEFTGEWCGNCPSGASVMKSIIDAKPDQVIGVAIHQNDPLEVPGVYNAMQGLFFAGSGVSTIGFPGASISRQKSASASYTNAAYDDRSIWSQQVDTKLAETAPLGLAMVTKESGDKLSIDLYIGHSAPIATDTRVTVYLIEDNVAETAPGAQASGGGSYVHQHVVRKVLTDNLGDVVDLNNAPSNKYTLVKFTNVDIAGAYKNKSNLKVVALVNEHGADATKLKVLNVQEAGIVDVKKWD